tara:strand:+ start:77 stop:442 length:366 start_codon:yes stop_codon:yes gene_type:complete
MGVKEIVSEISKMREEADKDWERLQASLRIEELCPGAFDHGSCTGSWQFLEGAVVYQIKKGNGDIVLFPFNNVPDSFKDEEIQRRGIKRGEPGRGPIERTLIQYANVKAYRERREAKVNVD